MFCVFFSDIVRHLLWGWIKKVSNTYTHLYDIGDYTIIFWSIQYLINMDFIPINVIKINILFTLFFFYWEQCIKMLLPIQVGHLRFEYVLPLSLWSEWSQIPILFIYFWTDFVNVVQKLSVTCKESIWNDKINICVAPLWSQLPQNAWKTLAFSSVFFFLQNIVVSIT